MSSSTSSSKSLPSVSIFYPYYNDWGTMGSMVLMTLQTAEKLGIDYDLTVVNDGSYGPQNECVIAEIKSRFPHVNIVQHEKNRGYGGALRSGFSSATREWVFYTDGDAQYDVRELALLIEKAGPEVDLVQGFKIARGDPFHRKLIGRVYHNFVKFCFGLKVRDTDCDFRLLRKKILDEIELTSDSGTICVELMYKIKKGNYRIVEVPVHHFERAHGKSQFFNFPRLIRTFRQLFELWWREIVRGGKK